mmetsp:Transcript_38044/g.107473  ORF Transcript_38044/g.107473 Transcript_38044/m.107473 type:complete len:119 (-) Transcript_38044:960-1316(-)
MRIRPSSSVSAFMGQHPLASSASFSSFDGTTGGRMNQRALSINELSNSIAGPSSSSIAARGGRGGQALGGVGSTGRRAASTSRSVDWACLLVVVIIVFTIRATVTPHKQYLQQVQAGM